MKVSTLIENIIATAEDKFGYTQHNLDCISVYTYVNPGNNNWQVGLMRPSEGQLDSGDIPTDKAYTIKQSDNLFAFLIERDTLLGALLALQESVEEASDWTDGHLENYRP